MTINKSIKHAPWTKFDASDLRQPPRWLTNPVPCPSCKGHTCCITDENAYGDGSHQKLSCGQCGSMFPQGWVEAGSSDATCMHDFKNGVQIGRCCYQYTCTKCGQQQTVDSGD